MDNNRFSITITTELTNGFTKAQTIEVDASKLFIDGAVQPEYYSKCVKLLTASFDNLSLNWLRTKREI